MFAWGGYFHAQGSILLQSQYSNPDYHYHFMVWVVSIGNQLQNLGLRVKGLGPHFPLSLGDLVNAPLVAVMKALPERPLVVGNSTPAMFSVILDLEPKMSIEVAANGCR